MDALHPFRLAGLYTLVVFGLAVLVVGSIYFAFSRTLEGKPVSGDLQVRRVTSDRGVAIYLDEGGWCNSSCWPTSAPSRSCARCR